MKSIHIFQVLLRHFEASTPTTYLPHITLPDITSVRDATAPCAIDKVTSRRRQISNGVHDNRLIIGLLLSLRSVCDAGVSAVMKSKGG